jgi:hypothetical protein
MTARQIAVQMKILVLGTKLYSNKLHTNRILIHTVWHLIKVTLRTALDKMKTTLQFAPSATFTEKYFGTDIYIYMYVCVCVCVCVIFWSRYIYIYIYTTHTYTHTLPKFWHTKIRCIITLHVPQTHNVQTFMWSNNDVMWLCITFAVQIELPLNCPGQLSVSTCDAI